MTVVPQSNFLNNGTMGKLQTLFKKNYTTFTDTNREISEDFNFMMFQNVYKI